MPCNRCNGTSSDPYNFLLSCSQCGKNWHHRCHIPPLSDPELTALLHATNENDVDNGLSSWLGRCCKRNRVRVAEAIPEVGYPFHRTLIYPAEPHGIQKALVVDSAPSARLVDIRQPRSLSVSPEIVVYGGSLQKAVPVLKQTTASGSGAAASPKPGDEGADGDPGFHKPVGGGVSQTTSVQPTVQHVHCSSTGLDRVFPVPPPQSITAPVSGSAPPTFHNQSKSFTGPLRESSVTLERQSGLSGQLAGASHAQALSQLSKRPTFVGDVSNTSTKSTSMDIDPRTLDLRALSLNRATRVSKVPSRSFLLYRTTGSRPHSHSPPPHAAASTPLPPAPPVKSEDSEMEDLYGGPTRETQRSAVTRRSLSPQLPTAESEPRVLPALAAKDPYVLAVLERQELREAARPRQGRRKSQPVRGAGKKRAGFVLVEGRTAGRAEEKSRSGISCK